MLKCEFIHRGNLFKLRHLYFVTNIGLDRNDAVDLLAAPVDGTTPLHDAVSNGHVDVAKLLLSAGGKHRRALYSVQGDIVIILFKSVVYWGLNFSPE